MDKKIYSYSSIDNNKLEKSLSFSLKRGLSVKEAKKRLKEEGANELENPHSQWWHILFRQFKSPFIYLLFLAAVLALFLGGLLDAGMIVLFILINSFLGFYQEFKSDQALKLLQQYTKSTARVVRDGRQIIIPSSELVRGDLVILETGDLVPADVRLLEDHNYVTVDEEVLTGESAAVHTSGLLLGSAPKNIYEAKNIVFTGTVIIDGRITGVVIATGNYTFFAEIKKLATGIAKESIFSKGISQFSSFILKLTVITLVFVFLANIFIKGSSANITELIIFAIALAVSVIPEALPVVFTLSLSRGALRLAKQKVIIKRLSAVEDLGSIEILCTDKTGTITENKLQVKEILPIDGRTNLLLFANLAGTFLKESLEPFDIALKKALEDKKVLLGFEKLATRPFEPKKRSNSVVVKDSLGNHILIVRGASEEVMKLCSKLDEKEKKIYKEWGINKGQEAQRVLAVATKKIENLDNGSFDILNFENDLNFEGCISFIDPIKKSAFGAIKKAKELGIGIRIITGDSSAVAFAVAREIGLAKNPNQVILASDFAALTSGEQEKILPTVQVFARTDPEQKHHLIKLLQKKYEVGFLGEGINDLPALKSAGVSIAVQGASDIARQTADVILLNKDLSVIIDGIEEGRKIFINTVKYLKATLASNFGNFYAVAIASLFIDFLPMLPIQLLLLNLLSDFPMISISMDSVDASEIKEPKKYNIKDIILITTFLGIVSTIFDFMFFGFFYKISPEVLQTNWFIGSVLTELVFLFSIRTSLPFYKAVWPSKTVIWSSGGAFLATIILPFTSLGKNIFHFAPPAFGHMAIILGLVVTYFIFSETIKIIYYKTLGNNKYSR